MAADATLYDVPVSNNGARIRIAIYAKGLEDRIEVKAPTALGGLKSDDYLALNPFGKMPLYVEEGGFALYESEVINNFVLEKYAGVGMDLSGGSAEERAIAALGTRIHDVYLQPLHPCLYKGMDSAADRAGKLAALDAALKELERICRAGPFFAGSSPSTADMALLPSFVFYHFMLEKVRACVWEHSTLHPPASIYPSIRGLPAAAFDSI